MRLVYIFIGYVRTTHFFFISVVLSIDMLCLTTDHNSNDIVQLICMRKSSSSMKTRKLPCTFDLAFINVHPLSFSTIQGRQSKMPVSRRSHTTISYIFLKTFLDCNVKP